MQKEVLAALIQVGTQIASKAIVMFSNPKLSREEYDLRLKQLEGPTITPPPEHGETTITMTPLPALPAAKVEPPPAAAAAAPSENKATSVKAGCIPCSLGHFGACNGMLSEAMRFARKEGLASGEVIDRANICLDELNALERMDMTPAMLQALPTWEKDLALKALNTSREVRHDLEGLQSVEHLEATAAKMETARKELGRAWFQEKFKQLPADKQQQVRDFYEAKKKEQENAGTRVPAASGF